MKKLGVTAAVLASLVPAGTALGAVPRLTPKSGYPARDRIGMLCNAGPRVDKPGSVLVYALLKTQLESGSHQALWMTGTGSAHLASLGRELKNYPCVTFGHSWTWNAFACRVLRSPARVRCENKSGHGWRLGLQSLGLF